MYLLSDLGAYLESTMLPTAGLEIGGSIEGEGFGCKLALLPEPAPLWS